VSTPGTLLGPEEEISWKNPRCEYQQHGLKQPCMGAFPRSLINLRTIFDGAGKEVCILASNEKPEAEAPKKEKKAEPQKTPMRRGSDLPAFMVLLVIIIIMVFLFLVPGIMT
jgi:hypothetical protein